MAQRLRDHRPFLAALAVGALLRVAVHFAFPPAFIYSDGPTYLAMVDVLEPSPDRVVGYGAVLRALSWVTRDVWAVAVVQHIVGLLTAVVLYAALRHWGVSTWVATLATLPVLFDGMQLVLEHSVLSDVVFDLLVVVGIALLGWWRPPRWWAAGMAGVVLGVAVLVRLVGEPMVFAAAAFCLAAAPALRVGLVTAVLACVGFSLPLVAYASWYQAETGVWALSQADGRALYMRTTSFVDCERLEVPDYQRTLCPREPLGARQDPTQYGWHDLRTVHSLRPPAGVTPNEAMRDFAMTAIDTQPWDYARTVGRDFVMTFGLERTDRYEYDTAYKWSFQQYVDYEATDWTGPAYERHGGDPPRTRHPVADWLELYGRWVYVPGPVLLALLLLTLVGLVVRRPSDTLATRSLIFLIGSLAVGLILLPDATAQFTWRYQLPAVLLLPVSAALAYTRLRGATGQEPLRRPALTGQMAG